MEKEVFLTLHSLPFLFYFIFSSFTMLKKWKNLSMMFLFKIMIEKNPLMKTYDNIKANLSGALYKNE